MSCVCADVTAAAGVAGPDYDQKKLIISNLPWGCAEAEVIDMVSHHAIVSKYRARHLL